MTEIAHEGFLKKRPDKGIVKLWKLRWFVLKNDSLYYYIDKVSLFHKGAIDLNALLYIEFDDNNVGCFNLVLPRRTYILMAPNNEERDVWYQLLKSYERGRAPKLSKAMSVSISDNHLLSTSPNNKPKSNTNASATTQLLHGLNFTLTVPSKIPTFYTIKCNATDLDRKDGPFQKSDPFFVLYNTAKMAPKKSPIIYKSEIIAQHLSPSWEPFTVDVEKIGGNDTVVRFECFDYDNDGTTDYIGFFECPLSRFAITNAEFELINPRKRKNPFYKHSGVVYVSSVRTNTDQVQIGARKIPDLLSRSNTDAPRVGSPDLRGSSDAIRSSGDSLLRTSSGEAPLRGSGDLIRRSTEANLRSSDGLKKEEGPSSLPGSPILKTAIPPPAQQQQPQQPEVKKVESQQDKNREVLKVLTKQNSKLREFLDFSRVRHLTEDDIKMVIEANIHVKKLNISDVNGMGCELVDWIVQRTRELTTLELHWCENVKGKAVAAVADNCPDLVSVSFSCCSNISAAGIAYLAERCKKIKKLDLSWVWNVNDDAMDKVSRLPLLTELTLSGCQHLTDKTLYSLAENAKSLQVLDLSRCEKLGQEAIVYLASSLPDLHTMILLGIDSITQEYAQNTFSKQFKNIVTGFVV